MLTCAAEFARTVSWMRANSARLLHRFKQPKFKQTTDFTSVVVQFQPNRIDLDCLETTDMKSVVSVNSERESNCQLYLPRIADALP